MCADREGMREKSSLGGETRGSPYPAEGAEKTNHGAEKGPYSINCLRLRWIIISCTEPIVIFSRFVSVALVKWP